MWFGIRSFWGHLRHFVAAAIATEDIDSRDWMQPNPPLDLADRVAEVLEPVRMGKTLVENLGRDLWIDFVADTGDDAAVSARVADILTQPYALPDPEQPEKSLVAPRGDLLIFGGDTAYPVATGEEINNRVIVPFNRVLQARDDGRERVLLGIPGNHDWYDGLDGFARMFRGRLDQEERPQPSVVRIQRHTIERYADFAKEFVRGGQISKPKTLDLVGYRPVQSASYFALPLSPQIAIFGVDRQLKQVDFRQRHFFVDFHYQNPKARPLVLVPDPVYKFGEPSLTGIDMIRSLELDLDREPHLILSGDIHHYERTHRGPTTHVIAGGGGAFLHPSRVAGGHDIVPHCEWPGVRQSRALLSQVPWKIALGRSGLIPHLIFALLFVPVLSAGLFSARWVTGLLVAFLVCTLSYALIGGVRRGKAWTIAAWAMACAGLSLALLPFGSLVLEQLAATGFAWWLWLSLITLGSVFWAAFVFGGYLALLTRLGLEHTQAFTALDHPGFKHFLRLRVRASGESVDVWCIGVLDPLSNEPPQLVDSFTWSANGADPRF